VFFLVVKILATFPSLVGFEVFFYVLNFYFEKNPFNARSTQTANAISFLKEQDFSG
jgi:hypothetical protein